MVTVQVDSTVTERQPTGAIFAGGDLDTQDLTVSVGVDAGRDHGVDPDDAATFGP